MPNSPDSRNIIKAFLPYFFVAWSDDFLSKTEFDMLSLFIRGQQWLADQEKEKLLSMIDTQNPPERQTLYGWHSEILEKTADRRARSLYELSLLLSSDDVRIAAARPAFLDLETRLGILGEAALQPFLGSQADETSALKTDRSFDSETMRSILDGDDAESIRRVKSIITRPEFAYVDATDMARYRETVLQWCETLAKEKLGSAAYPKQYGGDGDMKAYFAIMETLSYHDLSLVIKFGVQFGLWGMSVYFLGTEKHHREYLEKIGTMELPGCFAMTETGHGSNVKELQTTATYDHANKSFIIHTPGAQDKKEYIGNAAQHGQMATVFARLLLNGKDYGINAFVVRIRNQDMSVADGVTLADCGHKMGLNGVDNGTILFNQVVIPKEQMLDRFASVNEKGGFESPIPSDDRRFFTMLGTLVGGRIGIPRSALAAMKSGLTIAIRYGARRRQFGPEGATEVPILNYRMHQRRLFPYLSSAYALHFTLRYVTDRFLARSEHDIQEIEALAAGMKAYTTWTVRDALQQCREACGGKGYLSENRLGALKNDTEIYTTFEGDNTVLMQLVAKNRLSAFRKEYGKLDMAGMISYVWENARTAVSEKNPIATRRSDEEHLLDGEFHMHAFQYREKTILASAANRLKKLVDNGMDAYDAFNVAQHQMMDVAKAYLDRVILEQFQAAVASITDEACQRQLEQLCQLFALYRLESEKGWYLEQGYMESPKTKGIRKMVNQLCWELRSDAVPLVESFGIPEGCLAAEILNDKPGSVAENA